MGLQTSSHEAHVQLNCSPVMLTMCLSQVHPELFISTPTPAQLQTRLPDRVLLFCSWRSPIRRRPMVGKLPCGKFSVFHLFKNVLNHHTLSKKNCCLVFKMKKPDLSVLTSPVAQLIGEPEKFDSKAHNGSVSEGLSMYALAWFPHFSSHRYACSFLKNTLTCIMYPIHPK